MKYRFIVTIKGFKDYTISDVVKYRYCDNELELWYLDDEDVPERICIAMCFVNKLSIQFDSIYEE